MKALIACGGTGGHVFPGLATGEVLRQRGHDVTPWLAGRDIEKVSTERWAGTCVRTPSTSLPSPFSPRFMPAVMRLILAFLRCRSAMRKNRPDVLLAMGSYASVAPALAAWSLQTPVVLHEANAVPGRAISLLSHVASAVCVAFEPAAARLKHDDIRITGFPVRSDLNKTFANDWSVENVFTVVVMGGSQGARRLNEVATSALRKLRANGLPVQVVHLAGREDAEKVRASYEACGIRHFVFDFLQDVGKAYDAADLMVTRAGAGVCAEIMVCGVPALLVPLPSAFRDHQTANARFLEAGGGVDVLEEKDLDVETLCEHIETCIRRPDKLARMAGALKAMAITDAADRIADVVESKARAL